MSEPREAIASALKSYLTPEQSAKLIDEILGITKRASAEFTCKKCKQRQMGWTDIPDAKAVASALGDLLSQGFGRPSESSEKAEPILFKRLTRLEDEDVAVRTKQSKRRGHAESGRTNGEVHSGSPGAGEAEVAGPPDL